MDVMNEAQAEEILELMKGEHGEAIKNWGKMNADEGCKVGMIAGSLTTIIGSVIIAGTFYLGKTVIEAFKANMYN